MEIKILTTDCKDQYEVDITLKNTRNLILNSSRNRGKNVVALSTIHGSKGLEFNRVFIVNMVNGIFPTMNAIENESKKNYRLMEEERRLCYVALTRGRNMLI